MDVSDVDYKLAVETIPYHGTMVYAVRDNDKWKAAVRSDAFKTCTELIYTIGELSSCSDMSDPTSVSRLSFLNEKLGNVFNNIERVLESVIGQKVKITAGYVPNIVNKDNSIPAYCIELESSSDTKYEAWHNAMTAADFFKRFEST